MEKEQSTLEEDVKETPQENKSEDSETTESRPSGEKDTEKKSEDRKPVTKTDVSDYASKSETASKNEVNWEKRYSDSSREAQKFMARNKELEAKLKEYEAEAEKVETQPKPIGSSPYEKYTQKTIKQGHNEVVKEIEGKYPELKSDKDFSDRVKSYTSRFTSYDGDSGLLVNKFTNEPLTPSEFKELMLDGVTIANRDITTKKARQEGAREAYAGRIMNDLATSSTLSSETEAVRNRGDVPQSVIDELVRLGATKESLPKEIKRYKERQKNRR